MRRKGVVFSKMFVLRSMGNELVPSPLYARLFRNANDVLFRDSWKILIIYLFIANYINVDLIKISRR